MGIHPSRPEPEAWCTLDGEAMPYSEWAHQIGERYAASGHESYSATDPRWPGQVFEVSHPFAPLHPDWLPEQQFGTSDGTFPIEIRRPAEDDLMPDSSWPVRASILSYVYETYLGEQPERVDERSEPDDE
ncbi:hypothetical protein HII36_29840 [Nonomuraea sp. NN258]|uniref:hypothetical protein n=1 Tax=Nonomuraea antri TaxID=2730852 RepID=UPI0015686690|nr:hypothetical protein [Nonomuraea antri]NRQ36003.1 hypothetical protein [Nonomuraea antri]